MAQHYLAVLVPQAGGGWRVHFPDFPGCRAEGESVAAAVHASSDAVAGRAQLLKVLRVPLPAPQAYEEVRHHTNGWASERGINWSTVVVSLVPLSVSDY